jgi:hypothetical protein
MRAPLVVVTAFLILGCSGKPAAAADKGTLSYELEATKGPVKVKAGEKGAVKLSLKPLAGAHVDPRAPLSLEVTSGAAVQLAKTTLGHDDGKELATKVLEFEVPFTAKAAGADQIKLHADFYLCTAKICERQLADVAVAVVVE